MTKFEYTDFTKFVANYSAKNGELGSEYTLNSSPQRLKKELNNTMNIINILNGNRLLNWNPIEEYMIGELVQNESADDKYYRVKKQNENKRPDLFPDHWEIAENTDYTEFGDFTNFLAKDNITPYSPAEQYNPATKGYVDFKDAGKLDVSAKAVDSAKLNGEVVTTVLSNSLIKPAAVSLVKTLDNKVNTKLDASEFNATNVMAMVQNVDGEFSGLDADYLDGMSSEFFMKVGTTSNFDTMRTPGTYLLTPGAVGAPSATETYAVLVSGTGNYYSQLATSVTQNKLYYRSFVGSWSVWGELTSISGSIAQADKLSSPVTIGLSGDVSGSVSFDGSKNVTVTTTVANDSHTHDGRYFTEAETTARYLPLHGKADDAQLLDGRDSTQFLRKDINQTANINLQILGTLYIGAGITSVGDGNSYSTAGYETRGDGTSNTVYPSYAFHQPGLYAGTIQMRANGDYWFMKQGATTPNGIVRCAELFGTSSSATYADLAENYTAKDPLPKGTLVMIGTDDAYDIEPNIDDVFGVVSDKPGFLLDRELDGVPVALAGKTPVRVVGAIKKGDKITASGAVAIKALPGDKIIGIALESNTNISEKLIRCVVTIQL